MHKKFPYKNVNIEKLRKTSKEQGDNIQMQKEHFQVRKCLGISSGRVKLELLVLST